MLIKIDYRSVAKTLGQLLIVEALILLIPLAVALLCREAAWSGLLTAVVSSGVCGVLLWLPNRYHSIAVRRREGYMIVSLAWIIFSAFGMLPFMFGPHPLTAADAFFETVSGFTTTGATVIADVESLGKSLLLWRALTQWVGGLGIILFMLAILPWLNDKGGIPMFNAEVTGITHDKVHPRIRQTAATLWKVYMVMTLLLIILLWCGPMNLFDSVCQALATVSTGGFSTRNAGIAAWDNNYVNILLTLFMFAGGVNFTLIYSACHGNLRALTGNDVFRAYCIIVATAFVAIQIAIASGDAPCDFTTLVVEPSFHVVSAITTTGFSLGDFTQWGPFVLQVTILLMICGACAGSTTGAMKVDRVLALKRNLAAEVKMAISPKRMFSISVNGNVLSSPEMKRVMAFVSLYIVLIAAGTLLTCAFNIGFEDSFFAVVSCVGNNGLGYGLTGAAGGFHLLPDTAKWILSLLMIVGRLELFSMLVLFTPLFWRK